MSELRDGVHSAWTTWKFSENYNAIKVHIFGMEAASDLFGGISPGTRSFAHFTCIGCCSLCTHTAPRVDVWQALSPFMGFVLSNSAVWLYSRSSLSLV